MDDVNGSVGTAEVVMKVGYERLMLLSRRARTPGRPHQVAAEGGDGHDTSDGERRRVDRGGRRCSRR
jgi:hypothetical protein